MANYKSAYTGQQIDTAIGAVENKVDKVTGKGLSTNDYTNSEKEKLAGINMSSKQDTLVSGTNIKTINGQSILGSGNITVQGGSGTVSPWAGKVISIMGDSISTYNGYIPVADGHNLAHVYYYPRSTFQDVTKTWWHSLITEIGAKLGVNESWSGSYVCNTSDSEIVSGGNNYGTKCAMASNTRIENLGANGTPDLILVYGGTNDIWSGASRMGETVPGTFDDTQNYEINPTTLLATNKWSSFADAFRDMLLKMMYYYPTSRIVVLFPFYADSSSAYSHAKLDSFIEVQRKICDYFGINYIDLRACGINIGNNATNKNKEGIAYILTQNVHPNYDGMTLMKDYIKAKINTMFDTDGQENVVYTVTNRLTNATNSVAYIKGVTAGKSYKANITGTNKDSIVVSMGGNDITASITKYVDPIVINIPKCTGNIVITTSSLQIYTITTNVTNGTYSGATSISESGSGIVTISPNTGYKLPTSVTVTGATSSYDASTGAITLTNPTGNVVITANCPAKAVYSISADVNGGTATGATSITEGATATLTITPSEGYKLPDSITVVGASYDYNNLSGVISLTEPYSNVTISVTCVEAVTYTITTEITNGTFSGATTIPQGGQAMVTLVAGNGYNLPNSITVIGATHEYDKSTGGVILTNPTEDVTITANCVAKTSYTITVDIENGTSDGDSFIYAGESGEVVLSANQGYVLPETLTVTGATYSYDSATGRVELSNPTANIVITATCIREVWYSSNYNANTLNAVAGLQYAGFAYTSGVHDTSGLQMNMVRFVLNTPGKITVGKCSANFKTLVDSEQLDVTGSDGDVIILKTTKTYTLSNGEHFFINSPSGDSCIFKYANTNLPATQGDLSFMVRVGTSNTGVNGGRQTENLSVDFGLRGETVSYSITTTVSGGSYTGDSYILKSGTASVTISANAGYKLPASVIVENADYEYNSSTGVITLSNPSDAVVITAVCPALSVYTVTTTVTNGTHSGDTNITEGSTAVVTLTANSGYALPDSITVTGATHSYNNTTGVVNLSNPTGNVTITASCISVQTFTITTNVTNGTHTGATSIIEGGTAEVTVTADSRYGLPSSITVTGATQSYNQATGLIQLSNPTANVVITVVCSALPVYTITTNVTNGTYEGASDIAPGETKTVTITPTTDFFLPKTIEVLGTENYTYNLENGVITLFNPTADITLNVECTSEPPATLTWYSSNYNANTLNIAANLSYAGFAYCDGVLDEDGLQMNRVRFVLNKPGLMTFGKCSADFKTLVDKEQINVTGSAGEVKVIELSKTYTLENGEHFFINAPSGDTGLFKYCDRNVPATQGIRMFMCKAGTSSPVRNNSADATASKECLSVDFGYYGIAQ